MATGHLPFTVETVTETIDRIAHAQPEAIARFNYDVPAELEVIIKKALRKDRDERYQRIHDLLVDLRNLRRDLDISERLEHFVTPGPGPAQAPAAQLTEPAATSPPAMTGAVAPQRTSNAEYIGSEIKRHKKGAAVVLGATLLVVIVLGVGIFYFTSRNQSPAAADKTIASSNMKIARLTASGKVQNAAISPDGKYIVYAVKEGAQQSLWLRQVAVVSSVQILAPAEVEYAGETFSPDGNFIYYVAKDSNNPAGTLYQAPVLGGSPRKILTEVTSPVTFSPDASHIAFVRIEEQTTGEYILMIANVDGTNERRLAVRKGHEWFAGYGGPGWSPDGKSIAVSAGTEIREAYFFVMVVDVESGAQQQLSPQKFWTYGRISWLADGSGMVMNGAGEQSYLDQIWLMSYPGGETRQITHDLNDYTGVSLTAGSKSMATVQNDITNNIWVAPLDKLDDAKQITSGKLDGRRGLAWTPDGKIVFTSAVSGNEDIWTMNADGTNQKQLTDDPHLDRMPAVSPDGRSIVFNSNRTGSQSLWRMDIDGGNLKQLTSGQTDLNPQISPDARWIVFDSWRSGRDTLWKMPIDGGEPVQLTDKFTYWSGISPDGKLIACYYQEKPNSPVKLLVMSFEGGQPLKVFDLPTGPGIKTGDAGGFIVWTSDGRAVMYLDMRGGTRNLWRQPLDGRNPVRLTNFASNDVKWSVLSHDGKQIAFTRETITSDVVLLSDFR
jgi:Tol biopolymer transport system component